MQAWVLLRVISERMNYPEIEIAIYQIMIGSIYTVLLPLLLSPSTLHLFNLPQEYCYLSIYFYVSKCTKVLEHSSWLLFTLPDSFICPILLGCNNHECFLNGLNNIQCARH